MNLILGTAQFGLDYGLANKSGQVSPGEIAKILFLAAEHGLKLLDTAMDYGQSERALGQNKLNAFQVMTKLPALPEDIIDIHLWVGQLVGRSLKRLNIHQLYALLLHRPLQLFEAHGPELYKALVELKKLGQIKKIGISVYAPEEVEQVLDHYDLDLVQMPGNVFDQRFLDPGLRARLKKQKIEIHVRSVFLQGLLLLPKHQRPVKFQKWSDQWQKWNHWLAEHNLPPLAGCLRTMSGIEGLDGVLVGVDNLMQLQEIIELYDQPALAWPSQLTCSDLELINPSLWFA